MTAETDASDAHADGADARATGTHGETPTSPAGLTLLSDDDLYLFNEGSHSRLYDKLGCHPMTHDGQRGAYVAVWAPNADYVAVIGDFNGWDRGADPLHPRGSAGIWEGFVAGASVGDAYKFHIGAPDGYRVDKADPFATHAEIPPKTASVVWDDDHTWGDQQWMDVRGRRNALDAPMNIYEMHVGSWRRTATDDGDRPLSYRELADPLVDYLTDLNFTHVEFLPVMEHPFGGSWGYQVTGFFAPTSRFGTPEDFKYLVDRLHQAEIGVILDWVPSHFPTDEHGPGYFDGTHLFEHADPRQGIHPDWNSYIFNYGRPEVRSFLLSSALHWLDAYHLDGLRVDAVASMLYLDYSREDGEWIPNEYGGNENLDAIDFLRRLNEEVYEAHPDTQTIAEESTAWPMVSRPTYVGGLGFGMKWDMGWMHDTLEYLREEPIHRSFHHNRLTFRSMYAYTENFCLPLSHDEVVHGKGSLIDKMPGDEWQQFANLRAMFGYMYTTPGKKLLFMGGELAQRREWNHDTQLDWDLLNDPLHAGAQRWLAELSGVYRDEPALHRGDCDPAGWEWVDADDWRSSIITYLRKTGGDGEQPEQTMVVACNFTPVPRHNYLVGVPRGGYWNEVLNSDADEYGGSGLGNLGGVEAAPVGAHGRPHALNLTLPPLAVVLLKAPDTSRATTSTRQPVTGHSRRG